MIYKQKAAILQKIITTDMRYGTNQAIVRVREYPKLEK